METAGRSTPLLGCGMGMLMPSPQLEVSHGISRWGWGFPPLQTVWGNVGYPPPPQLCVLTSLPLAVPSAAPWLHRLKNSSSLFSDLPPPSSLSPP